MFNPKRALSILLTFTLIFGSLPATVPVIAEGKTNEPISEDASVIVTDNGDGTTTITRREEIHAELRSDEEILATGSSAAFDGAITEEVTDDTIYGDGEWRYTLNDNGFAIITGFTNAAVIALSVPTSLDGHPVEGIAANAFDSTPRLKTLRIPVVVTQLDPAFLGAVRRQVTIKTWTGTSAFVFAKNYNIPVVNLGTMFLRDEVVDLTSAEKSTVSVSEGQISVSGPITSLLDIGTLVYYPGMFCVGKVVSISDGTDNVTAILTEASLEESVSRVRVDFSSMRISDVQYAEYVESNLTSRANISGSLGGSLFNESLSFSFKEKEKEWGEYVKFKGTLEGSVGLKLSVTGELDFDVGFGYLDLNTFSFIVETSVTFSVELKGSFKLSIPLVRISFLNAFVASADADVNLVVEFSGTFTFKYSLKKEMGFEYNYYTGELEPVNKTSSKKSISLKAEFACYLEIKPNVKVKLLGEVASITMKAGVKAEASTTMAQFSTKSDEYTQSLNGKTWSSLLSLTNLTDAPKLLLYNVGSDIAALAGDDTLEFKSFPYCREITVSLFASLSYKVALTDSLSWSHTPVSLSLELCKLHVERETVHGEDWRIVKSCTWASDAYVTVILHYDNGVEDSKTRVLKGEYYEPFTPEFSGCAFDGWYTDANREQPYTKQRIYEETELFAKTVPNGYYLDIYDPYYSRKSRALAAGEFLRNVLGFDNRVPMHPFIGWSWDRDGQQLIDLATATMPEANTLIFAQYGDDPSYNPYTQEESNLLLQFELSGDGSHYIVANCSPFAVAITVPANYRGKPVTEIGVSAFENCNALLTVTLPNSIKKLGNRAFCQCVKLQYVSVPSALTYVGDEAFSGCKALLAYTLPDTVNSIGNSAFNECESLSSFRFPALISSTGNTVLWGCSGLVSVDLNNVTSIGREALSYCTSLPSINLSGVQSIGAYAFKDCSILNDIDLSHVQSLGVQAFMNCVALKSVDLAGSASVSESAFQNCSALASVKNLNAGTLGEYAFAGCTSLTEIDLTKVKKPGKYAFKGCSSLAHAEIPAAETIGAGLFMDCTSLEEFTFPEGFRSTGSEVLSGCSSLTQVTLNDIESIGSNCFNGCSSLQQIDCSQVTDIGAGAFRSCSKLSSVTLNSPVAFGNSCFRDCGSLQTLATEKGTSFGTYVFYNSGLTEFTLPEGQTILPQKILMYSAVGKVNLPSTLKKIDQYALADCPNLNTVYLPEGVTTLEGFSLGYGSYANSHVRDVYLPDTVTTNPSRTVFVLMSNVSIENITFYGGETAGKWASQLGCMYTPYDYAVDPKPRGMKDDLGSRGMEDDLVTEITSEGFEYYVDEEGNAVVVGYSGNSEGQLVIPEEMGGVPVKTLKAGSISGLFAGVTIPKNVTTIEPGAFEGATALKSFRLASQSGSWSVFNGCLYTSASPYTLIAVPQAYSVKTLTLPANTGTIATAALFGQQYVETVNCGSVTAIGEYAFASCPALNSVTCASVTEIGDGAFADCQALKKVSVGNSLKTIGELAFADCPMLTALTLPQSLESVGQLAFMGDEALTIYGSVEDCEAKRVAETNLIPYNRYTLTLNFEGKALFSIPVQAGEKLPELYEPDENEIPQGKWFSGWCIDTACNEDWDKENGVMPQEDLTLYGIWLMDAAWSYSYNTNSKTATLTAFSKPSRICMLQETMRPKAGLEVTFTTINKNVIVGTEEWPIDELWIPSCYTNIKDNAIQNVGVIVGDRGSAAEAYALQNGISFRSWVYNVSFDCGLGTPVQPVKMAVGDSISLPESIRDNYYLLYWSEYADGKAIDGHVAEEWTKTQSGDQVLTAQWVKLDSASTDGEWRVRYFEDGTVGILGCDACDLELTVPEKVNGRTVVAILSGAFADCDNIQRISIPESVTEIGASAFQNSSLLEINIGSGVNHIGHDAFAGCSKLRSIQLPSGLTELEDGVLSGCAALTELTLPAGIQTIGSGALQGLVHLTSLALNEGLIGLEDNALSNCSALKQVTLPASLINLETDTFLGCNALETVDVADGNNQFSSYDGVLMNSSSTEIVYYPSGKSNKEYTVPSGVSVIDIAAFAGAQNLEAISLPASIVSLGEGAFTGCFQLERAVFDSNAIIYELPSFAFSDCPALEEVSLPDALRTIGSNAFTGDESLALLTLPSALESIETDAFVGCDLLTLRGTAEQARFAETLNLPFILLDDEAPLRSIQLPLVMMLHEGEKKTLEMKVLPAQADISGLSWQCSDNDVATVDENGLITAKAAGAAEINVSDAGTGISARTVIAIIPFSFPDGTYIVLPAALREIHAEAFAQSAVTHLDLRETEIQVIGPHAFYNAELISLILPGTLTDISKDAFEGCSMLTICCPANSETYRLLQDVPDITVESY